jgi:hypothetical protein
MLLLIYLVFATQPRTIEEVVQLEEYVKAVDADTAPLREGIAEMVACNDLLDDFGYQASNTLLVTLLVALSYDTTRQQ